MKKLIILCFLSAFTLGLSGCVTRSYYDSPKNRGANAAAGNKFGSNSDEKVKSTKRVWIWQDEFNNPN
ncbi:hypothetical protein [Pontiella agarivorans]|uniref:Lipoprotein n=1 Tax=Pontiella agarivorans TaxID=3038953 RepID=A0ABU5MWS0_9BACT|nr:hypothetical protein [Pontiella agarivorans]MDZ8118669.1 hypothetical protein [Pontiella agarivorans]